MRRLAAQPGGLLIVDSVDGPGRAEAVAAALDPAGDAPGPAPSAPLRPVLLVSRLPLRAAADWGERAPVGIGLGPRPAAAVEAQARAAGVTDPEALALVVRVAGGVPLLADLACRALHMGIAPDVPGAAADWMAGEVLERLGRERPGQRWRHALRPGQDAPVRDVPVLVARALARLGDPAELARSPLPACAGIGSPAGLRAWLRDALAELAAAEAPADAEAGAILQAYYLGRSRTHHQVARRLHLSRATNFRRLRRGLALVAARLPVRTG
ncbi:hypothetical protein [Streptomyces sp. NBC_01233]|uniref:hypothetical protein n=1 Tax=Streptomyces sp. NBC_01233 TaxID=2903787 RepID=UPI002E105B1E|nr:hypothetical protein OG332_44305 [Streptomyces sp. NBC_01233]